MGRITLEEQIFSPFEVSLHELIALKKKVAPDRGQHLKRCYGAPLSKSRIRGRGMDFQETRHYFSGDDIRMMDWRVTARTGKPHVKVFEEERERPVMIFLDWSPSLFFGTKKCLKSVVAAQLAALLAWVAESQGDRVGGLLSSLEEHTICLPHTHHQSLIHFLKMLSQYTTHFNDKNWTDWQSKKRTTIFLKRLAQLRNILRPGTLILMISDWYHDMSVLKPYLYELRLHHDLHLYQILDSIEVQAPMEGIYPISNGEDILALNLQNQSAREAYQKQCDVRIRDLQSIAKKLMVPYQLCTSEMDLAMIARKSLRRDRYG